MAKRKKTARSRPAKAKPAEANSKYVEQLTAELIADPAIQAAWNVRAYPPMRSSAVADLFPNPTDLLGPKLDPFTNEEHCWGSAVHLFHKIEEHHGADLAKRMFKALAAPTKRQRKRLQDMMLWDLYEISREHDGVGLKKAARLIHERFGREYGATPDAIETHLKRLQRGRKKK